MRFYTFTDRSSGKCQRITLLYEPLFRIPEENRVIIPDFVIPEYCLVVEYAGLEERSYKFGLFQKVDALRKLGFPVIIMRPEDLENVGKSLNEKMKFYFDFEVFEKSLSLHQAIESFPRRRQEQRITADLHIAEGDA